MRKKHSRKSELNRRRHTREKRLKQKIKEAKLTAEKKKK